MFRPRSAGAHSEARRVYDRDRGSARRRGYTADWDKASASFLRDEDNVLCSGCLAVGVLTPAVLTDHIIPHRGDEGLFWDRDNWQSACRPHHDVVKPRLEAMFDRGEIAAADLRLASKVAQSLTRHLLR